MGTDISVDIKSKHFLSALFLLCPSTWKLLPSYFLLSSAVDFSTSPAIIGLSVKPAQGPAELQTRPGPCKASQILRTDTRNAGSAENILLTDL